MSSSTQLVAVAAVAFLAPLLLGLAPRLRVPGVVLEIIAGILLGPVLHWVQEDPGDDLRSEEHTSELQSR